MGVRRETIAAITAGVVLLLGPDLVRATDTTTYALCENDGTKHAWGAIGWCRDLPPHTDKVEGSCSVSHDGAIVQLENCIVD